jgi:hypothetical protein
MNKQTKKRITESFTTEDLQSLELMLNVLRSSYKLPEFTELQDGSFIAENQNCLMLLEEITHELKQSNADGNNA